MYVVENVSVNTITFTNDLDRSNTIKKSKFRLVKTKPLSRAQDAEGKKVIVVSNNKYPLKGGLTIGDITTYIGDSRFHTDDARILCMAETIYTGFKVGDLVKFKDPTSANARFFSGNTEDLEVKSVNEETCGAELFEMDTSNSWHVGMSEIEHMPVSCIVTHTADDTITIQEEFATGSDIVKMPKMYLSNKKEIEMSNQSIKIEVNGKSIDLCNETKAKKPKTGFQSRHKYTITTYTQRGDQGRVHYAHSKKNAKLLANEYLQDAPSGSKVTIAKEISAMKRKDAPLVNC